MTQARLAELCGVTQQAVSNWVHGHGRPGPESMLVIEKALGIPMQEWLEPSTPPARKRTGTDG